MTCTILEKLEFGKSNTSLPEEEIKEKEESEFYKKDIEFYREAFEDAFTYEEMDAIFAVVESTSGKLVFTDSDSAPIELKAYLNKGGVIQTNDVTYLWKSIHLGVGGSKQTLTVSRDDVPSARSFVCTITYGGKTYTDSIALSDKTDAIYCNIESSAGDKFTNKNIDTTLKCRVFNAYGEVDTTGTKYKYTWEKYVNGVKDANWRDGGKYVGKTVEITSNDVSAKATFSCTVTKATRLGGL